MGIRRYLGFLSGISTLLVLPVIVNLEFVWNGLDAALLKAGHEVNKTTNHDASAMYDDDDDENNILLSLNSLLMHASPHKQELDDNKTHVNATLQEESEKAIIRAKLATASTWDLLPVAAQDYLVWHNWIRHKFPDTTLITDPAAPKVFIHMCRDGGCGGTFDRLGRIENMFAFASLTNRILLFKWSYPHALEEFLEPHLCNWTAPNVPEFDNAYMKEHPVPDVKMVVPGRPWNAKQGFIHTFIQRHGKATEKILYSFKNLPGAQCVPLQSLQMHQPAVIGAVYRSLFRPSAAVQVQLDRIYHELDLIPGNYTAAHCRVRHPGFFGYKAAGKQNGTDADASGLIFEGQFKQKATEAALSGIRCTTKLLKGPNEPIYFLSDSEDLVEYVVHGKGRTTGPNQTKVDAYMANVTQSVRVVSRNVTGIPTLHINRQVGFPVEYYLPTFIDLYIAANARCVSFGVGNFGMLATKISGTTCRQEHNFMANRQWERKFQQDRGGAPQCRLPPLAAAP